MDDFGLDSGSYGDFFGGGSDLMSQFDTTLTDPTAGFGGDITQFSPQLQDPTAGYGQAAPMGQPQQQMGGGSFGLPGMLGLGGGLSSLLGTIMGGGMGPKPVMGVPQKAALNQAYGANQQLGQFAQGQTPLQQMQMSLLQALQSGQGLPPGYQKLIEQAFQPQMGSLYDQATQAGRARGFYDSPATAPPGGAILGPGLADLQGQMAQAKLNMMMGLPGVFQNPIQQQMGAAQGQAGGLTNLGRSYQPQQQAPLAPQIGAGVGGMLGGLGQGMAQNQAQQQGQQNFNSFLDVLRGRGNNTMSQTQPY